MCDPWMTSLKLFLVNLIATKNVFREIEGTLRIYKTGKHNAFKFSLETYMTMTSSLLKDQNNRSCRFGEIPFKNNEKTIS